MSVIDVRRDLVTEQDSLDDVVRDLTTEQWRRATASPGWNVFDQIAHLTFFDERASLAITDPEQFRRDFENIMALTADESVDEISLEPLRALGPGDLLTRWRENRQLLANAAGALSDESRVLWFGPTMGAKSFLSARLMETWAHGADIVDALGVSRDPTDRLRHVAQLGFNTRNWSYIVRGETPPQGSVRLDLRGPRGEAWPWGPDDADDTINGTAEDFCLVVTQRRHLSDTSLSAGELGRHWLMRAQAFAGAATDGPPPRSRQ